MTDQLERLPYSMVNARLLQLESVVQELLDRLAELERKPDPFQLLATPITVEPVEEDKPLDYAYLPENVFMHTMMRFYSHDDGRGCGYHSRLGKWTFGDIYECLRDHV